MVGFTLLIYKLLGKTTHKFENNYEKPSLPNQFGSFWGRIIIFCSNIYPYMLGQLILLLGPAVYGIVPGLGLVHG